MLIASLACTRPIEARLVGFPFAPSFPCQDQPLSNPVARRAARRIEASLASETAAEALSDAGIVEILLGRIDRAVGLLERARSRAPHDARVLADLGAAYLAMADRRDRLQGSDLVSSLEASTTAGEMVPGLSEAHFNAALALEKLGLREQAGRAWRRVARAEAGSPWGTEAARHLAGLSHLSGAALWRAREKPRLIQVALAGDDLALRQIVQAAPAFARAFAEEDRLGRWAVGMAAGRPLNAAGDLRIARAIGGELSGCCAEHMLQDAIAAIAEAQRGDPRRLALLVRGHLQFDRGLASERADRYELARDAFQQAADLLTRGRSPFALWARLHAAYCLHFLGEPPAALTVFTTIATGGEARRYPALVARSLWLIGLVDLVTGKLPLALRAHESARLAFFALHEEPSADFLASQVAVDRFFLGERAQAWADRLTALRGLPYQEDPRRVYSVLWEAAQAAQAEGLHRGAIAFLDELAMSGALEELPGVAAEVFLRRALVEQRAGDAGAAQRDLVAARRMLPRILDPSWRERVRGDLLVAAGELSLGPDPRGAAAALSEALAVYSHHGQRVENAALMRIRGLAHQAAGEFRQAAADFSRGLNEFESGRRSLGDEGERIAFFAQARALAEDLLILEVDHEHDSAAGLQVADWSKARALGDSLYEEAGESAPPASAFSIAALQQGLPPSTSLVEYAALEDRVLVWAVDTRAATFAQVPIAAGDLGRLVRRFRDALGGAADGPEARELAAELYDILLRPVAKVAGRTATVVFIPDGSLGAVPFAALVDRLSHQLVAERQACSIAPSARLYLAALARQHWNAWTAPAAPVDGPTLIVVNNVFDRGTLPDLPLLPAADREAARIASLYPGATVVAAAAATPRHVRELLSSRRFAIVHFAGHTVAMPGVPFSSAIVLAAESPGDSGLFEARQLAQMRLPGTRLVVLSSCSTATGTTVPLEGVLNLARPFLSAGVPAVMATLWDVGDQGTEALIAEFYAQLRRGLSPVAALHSTQLHFLHGAGGSDRNHADWAAFTIYGA